MAALCILLTFSVCGECSNTDLFTHKQMSPRAINGLLTSALKPKKAKVEVMIFNFEMLYPLTVIQSD